MAIHWKPQNCPDDRMLGIGKLPGRNRVALYFIGKDENWFCPIAYFSKEKDAEEFCKAMFGMSHYQPNV